MSVTGAIVPEVVDGSSAVTAARGQNGFLNILVAASSGASPLDPAWLHGINWHGLLLLGRHHSLSPHLAHYLLESGCELPVPIRARLKSEFQANLHRNFVFLNEARKILLAWRAQGIAGMPYKGPALAEQLWDSFALRECSDLDFLVQRADVERAGMILANLGYRRVSPVADHLRPRLLRHASEEQFRHLETGLLLELQWAPAPRTLAISFDETELWQGQVPLQVAGECVPTPAPAVLLAMLAIHGWKHNWSKLTWIADIAALLRRYDVDWVALQSSGNKQGWLRILTLALEMARRVYGMATPLTADAGICALATDLVNELRTARTIDYVGWHRYMLRARDSFPAKVAQLSNFTLTPGLAEYAATSLPRWAAPMYRAVRLARVLSLWPEKALA